MVPWSEGGAPMQERILVVDDDKMNLIRTKKILEKYYDVLLSESGADALQKLEEEVVDLDRKSVV